MNHASTRLRLTLATASIAALFGCGGDSSGTAAPPVTVVTPDPVTLAGVAASGAAFSGAVVTVMAADGTLVGTSAVVGIDGHYTVQLTAGAHAPFTVIAKRNGSNGDVESLVSIIDTATGTVTVNVTPITTLIAARLSPSGNPLNLANEIKAGTATVSSSTLAAKVEEIKQILQPVLTATGTSNFDPIKAGFSTDGTGHDRLLDTLKLTITPAGSQSSNIEIGIKQLPDSTGTQPPAIHFSSGDTLAEIKADPGNKQVIDAPIDPGKLVEVGTNALIKDLFTRLNACYALPLSSRVASGGTTATDVVGTACRTLFVTDDPGTYKSNGSVVAKGQSFNSLFVESATNLVWNQGAYEFTRSNGDIVLSYRTRSATGIEGADTFVVRKENSVLKLVGNQYTYPGAVMAFHQRRRFVTLDQSGFDSDGTGYVLQIPNRTDGEGQSLFDHVQVTTPRGDVLILKPTMGLSYLALVRANKLVSTTNFWRLRAEYINTSKTESPALKDTNPVYASPMATNDEIAAIPAQSVWTFKYYLTGNASTVAATQQYTTRARTMTIAEFRAKPLAALKTTMLAQIKLATDDSGRIPITGGKAEGLDWDVPTGALPLANIGVYGNKLDPATSLLQFNFNDTIDVVATARTATISCVAQTLLDTHCASDGSGTYAADSLLTGLQMTSKDNTGREFSTFYGFFKLN